MSFDLTIAQQMHCLGCLREHYVLNVAHVSSGGVRCRCGYVSERLSIREYQTRLGRRRREASA